MDNGNIILKFLDGVEDDKAGSFPEIDCVYSADQYTYYGESTGK